MGRTRLRHRRAQARTEMTGSRNSRRGVRQGRAWVHRNHFKEELRPSGWQSSSCRAFDDHCRRVGYFIGDEKSAANNDEASFDDDQLDEIATLRLRDLSVSSMPTVADVVAAPVDDAASCSEWSVVTSTESSWVLGWELDESVHEPWPDCTASDGIIAMMLQQEQREELVPNVAAPGV